MNDRAILSLAVGLLILVHQVVRGKLEFAYGLAFLGIGAVTGLLALYLRPLARPKKEFAIAAIMIPILTFIALSVPWDEPFLIMAAVLVTVSPVNLAWGHEKAKANKKGAGSSPAP